MEVADDREIKGTEDGTRVGDGGGTVDVVRLLRNGKLGKLELRAYDLEND